MNQLHLLCLKDHQKFLQQVATHHMVLGRLLLTDHHYHRGLILEALFHHQDTLHGDIHLVIGDLKEDLREDGEVHRRGRGMVIWIDHMVTVLQNGIEHMVTVIDHMVTVIMSDHDQGIDSDLGTALHLYENVLQLTKNDLQPNGNVLHHAFMHRKIVFDENDHRNENP